MRWLLHLDHIQVERSLPVADPLICFGRDGARHQTNPCRPSS
jgi:hypothetical protein